MRRTVFLLLLLTALGCGESGSEGSGGAGGLAGTDADGGGGDSGAAGGAGVGGAGATAPGGPIVEATFAPSDEPILNPERGFYDQVDLVGGGSMDHVRAGGRTLAYAGVRLDAYRDAPLDSDFLQALDAGFGRARDAGIKIVLRFVYNAGPYPNPEPDAPLARVLEHLQQLSPVLAENADVIAVLQAGLIGAWGEWHSSTNGLDTPENKQAIVLALLKALPETRMTQIRTPADKSAIFGDALSDAEAFSGTDPARTGHHNDCFLASPNDFGTYPDPVETWKDYVAQDGRFTPVGGETCALNPPRTDCEEATGELRQLHWSFINALYHTSVIDGWESQGCLASIDRELGYRFVLSNARYSSAVRPGGVLALEIELSNTGYASPFNARPVHVVLDGAGERRSAVLSMVDARRWASGQSVTVSAALRIPASAEPGSYTLGLWLPDASEGLRDRAEYAVRFANQDVWNESGGYNQLAKIAIDPAAPGDADPSATAFEELP